MPLTGMESKGVVDETLIAARCAGVAGHAIHSDVSEIKHSTTARDLSPLPLPEIPCVIEQVNANLAGDFLSRT